MTEETGTLAELDVKPGDVVECVEHDCPSYIGLELIIRDDGMAVIQSERYNGGFFDPHFDVKYRRKYRIVSRASATPKTWGEMTDEEQGALLLKHHRGEVIESSSNGTGWALDDNVGYSNTLYYRVRPPEPKRETVELRAGGLLKAWEAWSDDDDTHRITFDVIDGTPDCASIRMEEL
jgi:hypothetical protein